MKSIFLVDDSATMLMSLKNTLEISGFQVEVAADGEAALQKVKAGLKPDLIITDINMPRLDGIGLVSLIKADPVRKDIPVVIVSYKDREEDRLRGLEAGANRYLTKTSFHDETFLQTIVDLIGEPND